MTKEASPQGARLVITPSQTVGPFFAYALTPTGRYALADLAGNDLATEDAAGMRIRVEGRVLDGEGAPVTDAMIEIWQADGEGRYAGSDPALSNSSFRGFGRSETDDQGRYSFQTVKPGRVAGPNGASQAPHINVGVFARGVLRRMFTRLYFEDEGEANRDDPILGLVPEDARYTLVAKRDGDALYAFDIRLQGDGETVFFEA
jgi:protocatechuate 3,4-dioxygenase, alpha subunit